jgi:hypothetical protein
MAGLVQVRLEEGFDEKDAVLPRPFNFASNGAFSGVSPNHVERDAKQDGKS